LIPEPLSFDFFATASFLFILSVQFFEFRTPTLEKSRAFVRAHQSPYSVFFHAFHKKIRNPQGVEKISRSIFLSAIVFAQLQKVYNVSMPRFYVNSE